MWLALLAFAVSLTIGLRAGWTVTSAAAAEVSLLLLVLVEAGLRALRRNLAGVYTDRGFSYYLVTMSVAVLGLAWLGEQLSLGRVGPVPSLTLALEFALAFRMLGHVDAIREALVQPPGGGSDEQTSGGWPGDGKRR
ncbi:MAG: hypothetical protein M5U09_23210 [Gammaproteobacteria bacterium]|nr:hypothetical protein [Gammaproteobacteria bacterium]